MKNSDCFYKYASDFQTARKSVMDKYEKRIVDLQPMKGSQYYIDEMSKAEKDMKMALEDLMFKYGTEMRKYIRYMRDANHKRPMEAPTAEMVNMLTVLRMKDSVTSEEIQMAANAMKSNALALSVLQEIANKHDLHGNFFRNSEHLPVSYVSEILDSAESVVDDFLKYDTTAASRRAHEHNTRLYGESPDMLPLTKRKLFSGKEECFNQLFGISSSGFFKAVDD